MCCVLSVVTLISNINSAHPSPAHSPMGSWRFTGLDLNSCLEFTPWLGALKAPGGSWGSPKPRLGRLCPLELLGAASGNPWAGGKWKS